MKKKIIPITLIAAFIIGCCTIVSFGATKTKSMTAYKCIKSGDYVYCLTAGGVYRTDLRNNSKKRIAKAFDELFHEPPVSMTIKKGYVYYLEDNGYESYDLFRVSTSGKNKKALVRDIKNYAVSGSKVYYRAYNKKGKLVNKVMNLDGQNKKNSNYSVKMKNKKSNNSKYYVFTRKDNEEKVRDESGWLNKVDSTDCLQLPDGNIVELFKYTDYYII